MANQHARVKLAITAAALALFLTGCSSAGDDDALPPLEPTATTEPAPTSSTTTTEPTITTTTTTTAEPTTTTTETTVPAELDPAAWDSPLDEIFGRYLLYWQALDEAYAPPQANPDYEPLVELVGPEMLIDVRANLERHRDAGHVIVFPEGSVEEHVLRLPRPVSLTKAEDKEIIIQDCWIADHIRQAPEGNEADTVFYFPNLSNVTMKVIGGEWRVFASVTASGESDGWDECNEYFANLDR